VGQCSVSGICHSWSADGRCISLLKILFSNACVYDCAFCVNRRSNDIPRATFDAEELVSLTVNLYRRNYIEGLFLSSGIWRTPDETMAALVRTAELLRRREGFGGYIHLKAIPGCSDELIRRGGLVADRMSVNIELPSQDSLKMLAPQKSKERILLPMNTIGQHVKEYQAERKARHRPPPFVPAGQSTQMVIGATPDSDWQILRLSQGLYRKFDLKRVYYSAYVPVNDDSRLPALREPPLRREHRLYQADWLLRNYGFQAEELLAPEYPHLDTRLDPKTAWALRHPAFFPVEVNRDDYHRLLRVPGLGVRSAQRICAARRHAPLRVEDLSKIGIILKRAQFFLTVSGRLVAGHSVGADRMRHCLLTGDGRTIGAWQPEFRLFSDEPQTGLEVALA
jgi:putative DNA modification/repair radical SAM protein